MGTVSNYYQLLFGESFQTRAATLEARASRKTSGRSNQYLELSWWALSLSLCLRSREYTVDVKNFART